MSARPSLRHQARRIAALVVLSVTATVVAAIPAPAQAATASAIVNDSGCSTHHLARNDDGSTARVALPFAVNFYNQYYDSLFVNNNGNVTFSAPLPTYTPFQITASTPPIIAAFLADVDTRPATSGITSYGVTSYAGRPAFCVNWRRVGYFSNHTDKTDSFQLLLVNTDSQNDFDIVMNYGSMKWESGEASGGTGGLGGTSAGVGFSNGDGNPAHFLHLPGSLVNGSLIDSGPNALLTHTNEALAGRFVYHVASGRAVSTANLCKEAYFVSVRGSGETSTGVDDKGDRPGGAQPINAIYKAFIGRYTASNRHESDVAFYQTPYQALGVETLGVGLDTGSLSQREDRFFQTNLPKYVGSIQEGQDQLSGYLDSVHRTCASQHRTPKVFLAGYSQGSLVIHRYLNQLSHDATNPVRNDIVAVGLLADAGALSAATVAINWGTASNADYGVCHTSKVYLSVNVCQSSEQDIPSIFAHRTQVVCDSHDLVCDTSRVLHDALSSAATSPTFSGAASRFKAAFVAGAQVHTTYTTRSATELVNLGRGMYQVSHI